MSEKCPAGCGSTLTTTAEKAAHVCPLEGGKREVTGADVERAAEATRTAAVARAALRPTREQLVKDAAELARHVGACWDGEVECIVLLAPVGTNDVSTARLIVGGHRERARRMLKIALERLDHAETPLPV